MIIESLVLIGAYVGKRLLERKQESTPSKDENLDEEQDRTGTAVPEEDPQRDNHYLKTTSASLGLSAVRSLNPSLALLSTASIIYNSFPVLREAEKSLVEERKIGNDVLVSSSIFMGLTLNFYLPLTVGAWFYYIGRKMISKARNRSRTMITQVYEKQPRTVWLAKDGAEIEVPLETLNRGDVVVVSSGSTIPVDGAIADGMAMIDQYLLTGESQLAEKDAGDTVFASTMVVSGRIFIEVEKTEKETAAAQIASILNAADSFKIDAQLKGEEWADTAALPLMIGGGLALPLLGPASSVVILNSSIGNPIRIQAPLGTLNHITLASQRHILIKNGQALEKLNQVDTVLFDKTGTLTEIEPEISRIVGFNQFKEEEILRFAAIAESRLSHPIAHSILKKAEELNLELPYVDSSEYHIGYGIEVRSEGVVIKVGSLRYLKREGMDVPKEIEQAIEDSHVQGSSSIVVAVDDRLVGAIELQASVRPEVERMISGLRQRGIKQIHLISGDHRQATQKLAAELGMDGFSCDILPQEKAYIVEQLQREGRTVCFVGDGINDTIAMQKADLSISLSGAATIATDVAPIVLMDGSLTGLNDLFDISKNLNKNMKNSLLITLIPAAINIPGALVFGLGVMASYIIKMSFFMVGVGNAMLPLKTGIKPIDLDDSSARSTDSVPSLAQINPVS
jgi:heavy metal translocating P-type ATPase